VYRKFFILVIALMSVAPAWADDTISIDTISIDTIYIYDSVPDTTVVDTATADSAFQELSLRERLRQRLTANYYKIRFDSIYVIRPIGKVTLKLRVNQTGNTFHARGTVRDVYSKADLATSHKTTFAVAAIYRGIGVGFAINPAKWGGIYKDYEFNLNFYSRRFSLDFSYQRSESLSGDIRRGDTMLRMEKDDVEMNMVNFAATYTFNHRKFSYQAAFTQSYIQRRSAGSWLACLSYQGGSLKTTDALKSRNPQSPEVRIYLGHVGIGGGYGYNWVLGRRWLLHLSVMPTFVVFNRNNLTINGERKKAEHVRFNMIFNERLAVVFNISPRFFVGATLVMNNSVFDDSNVIINQNKWRARGFFGMRL